MIVIQNLVVIDKSSAEPVYQQLADGIARLIRQGHLKPGAALPSSRKLAATFDLHRKTVVAAYDELQAQGWAEAFPRRGLFIADKLPVVRARRLKEGGEVTVNGGSAPAPGVGTGIQGSLATPPAKPALVYPAQTDFPVESRQYIYDHPFRARKERLVFNEGFPDTRLAPVDLLIREYRRFSNYRFTAKFLSYGAPQGSENLRNELARFLNVTRGLAVSPANILITKGAQMAMYLLGQIVIKQGEGVAVGDPGYVGASEVFRAAGAEVCTVPVDEDGMDIGALERLCRNRKLRMVYVIPHHHTPTTVTLCADRRKQLLALAKRYSFAVLEDDYDFDFHYSSSPILPLASIDTCGNVIYVGSFCKTVAPAIRIGFMVAPVNLIEQAVWLRKLVDRQGEQLMEEAMANLLGNGDIDRHLKKANKIYHERRDRLCGLLRAELGSRVEFVVPDGGFAVWTKFHGKAVEDVAAAASRLGLAMGDGDGYWHDPEQRGNAVRLGFASLNEKEMEEAVGILKRALK